MRRLLPPLSLFVGLAGAHHYSALPGYVQVPNECEDPATLDVGGGGATYRCSQLTDFCETPATVDGIAAGTVADLCPVACGACALPDTSVGDGEVLVRSTGRLDAPFCAEVESLPQCKWGQRERRFCGEVLCAAAGMRYVRTVPPPTHHPCAQFPTARRAGRVFARCVLGVHRQACGDARVGVRHFGADGRVSDLRSRRARVRCCHSRLRPARAGGAHSPKWRAGAAGCCRRHPRIGRHARTARLHLCRGALQRQQHAVGCGRPRAVRRTAVRLGGVCVRGGARGDGRGRILRFCPAAVPNAGAQRLCDAAMGAPRPAGAGAAAALTAPHRTGTWTWTSPGSSSAEGAAPRSRRAACHPRFPRACASRASRI